MKINVYLTSKGAIRHYRDGSQWDQVAKTVNSNEETLIHTYEIPEKNECSMNPKTEGNIFSGAHTVSSESPNMCIRCGFKFEKNEENYRYIVSQGGQISLHWNDKPIINPHLKKARPSYREAFEILKIVMEERYDPKIVLRDLGFEENGEWSVVKQLNY